MSYVPQVGDRVRQAHWTPGDYAEVEYVGRERLVGHIGEGIEGVWWVDSAWEKLETPVCYPEVWMNIYPGIVMGGDDSRATADRRSSREERIGVLHLFPDGHTEMEAP